MRLSCSAEGAPCRISDFLIPCIFVGLHLCSTFDDQMHALCFEVPSCSFAPRSLIVPVPSCVWKIALLQNHQLLLTEQCHSRGVAILPDEPRTWEHLLHVDLALLEEVRQPLAVLELGRLLQAQQEEGEVGAVLQGVCQLRHAHQL